MNKKESAPERAKMASIHTYQSHSVGVISRNTRQAYKFFTIDSFGARKHHA